MWTITSQTKQYAPSLIHRSYTLSSPDTKDFSSTVCRHIILLLHCAFDLEVQRHSHIIQPEMRQKPKERGIFARGNTEENADSRTEALWQVCNWTGLDRHRTLHCQNQDVDVIFLVVYTHVLVEGASDTSCHVQERKHVIALQQIGPDSRSSPLDDVGLRAYRQSRSDREHGNHRQCPKVAVVN